MILDTIVIALLQDRPGSGIRASYKRILQAVKPDVLAFPEYYFVGINDKSVLSSCAGRDGILGNLRELSSELGCVLVGGTVVENIGGSFFNRCYVLDSGVVIGHYDKIHPFDNEGRGLIGPGFEYKVFDVRGLRIGVLICADVLHPDSFSNILGLRPDMIIVPTTSPYRENESASVKFARDQRLFARGAERARCPIFKVCASDRIAGHKLQGRSLIALPGAIRWRIDPQFEQRPALVICRLKLKDSSHELDIEVHRE